MQESLFLLLFFAIIVGAFFLYKHFKPKWGMLKSILFAVVAWFVGIIIISPLNPEAKKENDAHQETVTTQVEQIPVQTDIMLEKAQQSAAEIVAGIPLDKQKTEIEPLPAEQDVTFEPNLGITLTQFLELSNDNLKIVRKNGLGGTNKLKIIKTTTTITDDEKKDIAILSLGKYLSILAISDAKTRQLFGLIINIKLSQDRHITIHRIAELIPCISAAVGEKDMEKSLFMVGELLKTSMNGEKAVQILNRKKITAIRLSQFVFAFTIVPQN